MKRVYAEKLAHEGKLRMGNLTYYRQLEDEHLGDENEGLGLYYVDDRPMQTESINKTYVWCSSLPSVSRERMQEFALSSGYDCRLVINNPLEFIRRVNKVIPAHFYLHIGCVRYDRGNAISKELLNRQKFDFQLFQKDAAFSDQDEYRIAAIDNPYSSLSDADEQEHIARAQGECCRLPLDLSLGNCDDIMSIEVM